MRSCPKKALACLLAVLQLAVLLPLTAAQAAEVSPVRNPVVEGTVRFGSFNFNGDIPTGRDGIDYVSTFYYTDDHFSPSVVNPGATRKVMDWRALDNPSLATLSKQFAVAVYGSSEGNVPVDWSEKSKNGERFLADCGFENIFVNDEFNTPTGKDTLGYLIGSKRITVWDQRTQTNRPFTLVAVGVRGGGYGGEWASNLTIGDRDAVSSHDKSFSGTYRHEGFGSGAKRVLNDLDAYLDAHGIRGDVKYWVCGYSRSGAIANLVAGDITKAAGRYHTTIDDVYGYTYESAAAALVSEDPDGSRFPNLHNILNPMDLVPLFSPRLFGHGRLGVDYLLPYHANAGADNAAYYNAMRAVLPVVADIATIYDRDVTGNENDKTEDPVITDSDPAVYPFDRPIQIKSFGLTNFSTGFNRDVANAESVIAPDSGLYLDEFNAKFLDAFLNSRAWDTPFFRKTITGWDASAMQKNDWQSHEKNYVSSYQEALRTFTGAAFKTPGKGLRGLDGLTDKLLNIIDLETIFNAAGILSAYAVMDQSRGGLGYVDAVGNMMSPMSTVLTKVVDQLGLFDEEDLPQVHGAIATITPVLTWLYCEDHVNTDSEYFGTLFSNLGNILVTHTPEMEVSWLMSLDDVFRSDFREITVPQATVAELWVFRPGLDDALSAEGRGALIARAENGALHVLARRGSNQIADAHEGSYEITVTRGTPERTNPFRDVAPDAYYYDAALWAVAQGVTNGMSETEFAPELPVTRGQMVTFLWRHAGKPAPGAGDCPFTDVDPDQYYADAVRWAYEKGVTNGMSETEFAPEQAVTRGQMATFLWRYAGKPAPGAQSCPFTDVDPGQYYGDAVRWAYAKGVTNGVTETLFAPDSAVTRGQTVTFLYRYAGAN